MTDKNENLEQLLTQFMDADEAARAAEDIRAGDELLESCPDVQPNPDVIAAIKSEIHKRIERRTSPLRIFTKRISSAAAVIIVLAFLGVTFYDGEKMEVYTGSIAVAEWDIDKEDLQLTEIAAELDEVLDSILEIRLEDYQADRDGVFEELEKEIEAIAVKDDFWDG